MIQQHPNLQNNSQISRISKSQIRYVQTLSNDLHVNIQWLDELPPVSSRRLSVCKKLSLAMSDWKLKRAARALWHYCKVISNNYVSINATLEFPVFPERCGRLTHLSAQIWILTYALKDIAPDKFSDENSTNLNKTFKQLIEEAMLTKQTLMKFTSKIKFITFSSLASLQDAIDRITLSLTGQPQRQRRHNIMPPMDFEKSLKTSVLTGSKIEADGAFINLRLYMRTNERNWLRVTSCSIAVRLQLIVKGLEEATKSFQTIRSRLNVAIHYVDHRDSCCHTTLKSAANKMDTELKKMLKQADGVFSPSILQVGITLKKSAALVHSLQLNRRKFTLQILEAVAMTGICFRLAADNLQIPIQKSASDSIVLKTNQDEFTEWDYVPSDFYKTSYPDILRKVPVIVNQNELSLHKHVRGDEELQFVVYK